VALNCVVNERLQRESGFRDFFFAPFSEDSGPALGAAIYGLWQLAGQGTWGRLRAEGFGHQYTSREVNDAIEAVPGLCVHRSPDALDAVVSRMCDGKIGGWFQGGSELGPRALGRRSIVADPRRPALKAKLNDQIKRREGFRPFAPSVLAEHVAAWFEVDEQQAETPFMLRTFTFRDNLAARVPAVAHVDNTARIQSVREEDQPEFYELIRRFHACTDVPMLLNTSMNGAGQPIVETPRDALWAMLELGLDFVVIEGLLVEPAPDYASMLEFVPVIAAESFTVERALDSQPMSSDVWSSAVFTFRVSTPWGTREHEIASPHLELITLIDGTATGFDLHREMCSRHGDMDSDEFARLLIPLRRTGVIDLRAGEHATP